MFCELQLQTSVQQSDSLFLSDNAGCAHRTPNQSELVLVRRYCQPTSWCASLLSTSLLYLLLTIFLFLVPASLTLRTNAVDALAMS